MLILKPKIIHVSSKYSFFGVLISDKCRLRSYDGAESRGGTLNNNTKKVRKDRPQKRNKVKESKEESKKGNRP